VVPTACALARSVSLEHWSGPSVVAPAGGSLNQPPALRIVESPGGGGLPLRPGLLGGSGHASASGAGDYPLRTAIGAAISQIGRKGDLAPSFLSGIGRGISLAYRHEKAFWLRTPALRRSIRWSDRSFLLADVVTAYRLLESQAHVGKIVSAV